MQSGTSCHALDGRFVRHSFRAGFEGGHGGITLGSFKSDARYTYSPTTTTQNSYSIFHIHGGGILSFVKAHNSLWKKFFIYGVLPVLALTNHIYCFVLLS